jgi:5-methylcytosine-specific restriction endonuclease McrA
MALPRCLILNATNEYLSVREWDKALKLMAGTYLPEHLKTDSEFLSKPKHIQRGYRKTKVEVLAWHDEEVHSERESFRLPAVMRLRYCVRTKKQERLNALTLRNLLVRDNFKCQYCGARLTLRTGTKDHVVPQCQGGPTTWENVVAACKPCNNFKDNMSLEKFEHEWNVQLDRSQLRKPTEEEKIKAALKGFKSKEKKAWIKCFKEQGIELW